jgi:hypothetical protein
MARAAACLRLAFGLRLLSVRLGLASAALTGAPGALRSGSIAHHADDARAISSAMLE